MIEQGKILQQRYRIDKQIGQGGMGAVYVATDERFGSMVAIKETLCMDGNYRKALEREARLLNSLKHVALPRVSDHFIEENGQFLVMEFIPGDDLAFILEQTGKPFPFEKVQKWADQLLEALEFLHTQSMPVIHRDIKPQNLKITAQGQIVLLDFGLAKGNPTDAGVQTAAKSIFGYSRNYASLEQIQGTGTDPRSDLYSLAATLYHLATGQAPEDALTRAMSVLSNQPDPLVPANHVNSSVPAGFAGVLQKALDLNAASRPATANEMRQMLRNMDAFAHLAADVNLAETVANFDLGSQKTQLLAGDTKHGIERQTDVKTEVLPAYVSQETALRTAEPNKSTTDAEQAAAVSRKPRRFTLAAGALVLALCGLAAGAYVYSPILFSAPAASTSEPQSVAPVVEQQPASVAETVPDSLTPQEPASAETAAASRNQEQKTEAAPVQDKEPVRAAKTTSDKKSAANNDATAAGDNEIKVDSSGETVYVGNVKIKNGTVETPDTFIDENGVTRKVPPVPPVAPIQMPDLRHLTPMQRRKVLQQLRRKGLIPPPERQVQPRTKY